MTVFIKVTLPAKDKCFPFQLQSLLLIFYIMSFQNTFSYDYLPQEPLNI